MQNKYLFTYETPVSLPIKTKVKKINNYLSIFFWKSLFFYFLFKNIIF